MTTRILQPIIVTLDTSNLVGTRHVRVALMPTGVEVLWHVRVSVFVKVLCWLGGCIKYFAFLQLTSLCFIKEIVELRPK